MAQQQVAEELPLHPTLLQPNSSRTTPSSQLRSIYAIVTQTLDNIRGVLHSMQTTYKQTCQLYYPVILPLYLSLFFTRDP